MERLRRRPSSWSEEDEGWATPVIFPPLVQRGDEGLERRVASSPLPQHTSTPIAGRAGQPAHHAGPRRGGSRQASRPRATPDEPSAGMGPRRGRGCAGAAPHQAAHRAGATGGQAARHAGSRAGATQGARPHRAMAGRGRTANAMAACRRAGATPAPRPGGPPRREQGQGQLEVRATVGEDERRTVAAAGAGMPTRSGFGGGSTHAPGGPRGARGAGPRGRWWATGASARS
jgi:hypothetical protein